MSSKIQDFFYGDDYYCNDLRDLTDDLGIYKENVNSLKDDWSLKIEFAVEEPIFKINAEYLCQLLADANKDRITDFFKEKESVLKALEECVDFDKLNNTLPKYVYPNGNVQIITKNDIINFFLKNKI